MAGCVRIGLACVALLAGDLAVRAAEPVTARPAAAIPLAEMPPALAAAVPKPAAMPVPVPVKISSDPRPTLGPGTFVATLRAVETYRALAEAGGWPTIPVGTALKMGDRGDMVALLRRRLAVTGDLPPEAATGDVFDAALDAGVRHFQARHGLPEGGLVGARTVAALNVSADTRVRQLSASAGRLMGSKFPFGERYVTVNIPSAAVEAVQGGVVVRRYVAVVGKPDRASPQVETRITNVNFNPTWTVPVSLIKKDIIPHVRKDPAYLAKMRIHVLDGAGNDVDPNVIDWATDQAANYTLRQDPGVANSLGEVRIDMPNRHAVYMHDTPSKRLFARDVRFESSGCVRVAGVRDLIAWLLEGAPAASAAPGAADPAAPPAAPASWGAAEIDAAIASGRRLDVKLPKPVPVAWVYLTGYAGADGTIQFRDDPYGLDTPRAEMPPAPAAAGPTIDALVTGSIAKRR